MVAFVVWQLKVHILFLVHMCGRCRETWELFAASSDLSSLPCPPVCIPGLLRQWDRRMPVASDCPAHLAASAVPVPMQALAGGAHLGG